MKQQNPSSARVGITLLATGAVLPVLLTVLGVVWIHSLADQLPALVATHWGLSGTADSFGDLSTVIIMIWLIGAGIPAIVTVGVIVYVATSGPDYRAVAIVATSSGTAAFVAALMVFSTVSQQDSPDLNAWTFLVAFAVGGGIGALIWFATPHKTSSQEFTVEALPIGTARSQQWQGTSTMGAWAQAATWSGTAALAATSVGFLIWQGLSGTTGILLLLTVLIALFSLMCTRAKLTVDRHGLKVSSVLGWPSWKIPLSQISEVELIWVSPLGDFGGWGLRMGLGGLGVILSKGEAIRVRKTDGSYFTVTADDASKGAAVLENLLVSDSSSR